MTSRTMVGMISFILLILLLPVSLGQKATVTGEKVILVGTLLGEKCVETGKLASCYVEWAYPMVLYNRDGAYRIELHAVGVEIWELDRAFGKKVAVKGILLGDRIRIRSMAPLEPLEGGKLTKACL